MLFHAFSELFYTLLKSLDYHAKHGQSKKKKSKFGSITDYFCAKNLTSGFVQVSEGLYSNMALADINDGGTPYMGISPRKTQPVPHQTSRSKSLFIDALHPAALHGTRSGRMSFFTQEVVFLVVRKR